MGTRPQSMYALNAKKNPTLINIRQQKDLVGDWGSASSKLGTAQLRQTAILWSDLLRYALIEAFFRLISGVFPSSKRLYGVDSFDRAILQQLQIDSRISTEQLGELLGLSASACQRRIRKLRDQGIISGEVALLNSEKLPGYSTLIVDIFLDKCGMEVLDKLIAQLQSEDQVQQIYYTVGETDLIVIILARSMDEYDKLTRRLLMNNNNIRRFTSKAVIKTHKASLAIPLQE